MNMSPSVIKFIKNISIHDIPHKFIHSARVVGDTGEIITITGIELEKLLKGEHSCSDMSFMVDVNYGKLIEAIEIETEYMFMLAEKIRKKNDGS